MNDRNLKDPHQSSLDAIQKRCMKALDKAIKQGEDGPLSKSATSFKIMIKYSSQYAWSGKGTEYGNQNPLPDFNGLVDQLCGLLTLEKLGVNADADINKCYSHIIDAAKVFERSASFRALPPDQRPSRFPDYYYPNSAFGGVLAESVRKQKTAFIGLLDEAIGPIQRADTKEGGFVERVAHKSAQADGRSRGGPASNE